MGVDSITYLFSTFASTPLLSILWKNIKPLYLSSDFVLDAMETSSHMPRITAPSLLKPRVISLFDFQSSFTIAYRKLNSLRPYIKLTMTQCSLTFPSVSLVSIMYDEGRDFPRGLHPHLG